MKKFALTSLILASFFIAQTAHADTINGSGSTFVKNFIEQCIPDYAKATGNTVNYAGGGSGAGRNALTLGTVDFAISDTPYGTSESKPGTIYYIPLIAGPIAITYRLDGYKGSIQLSKEVLAGIFAGQITNWNNKLIIRDNTITTIKNKKFTISKPKLPSTQIKVFYRSDASGTSQVFTDYLHTVAGQIWTKAGNKTFTSAFVGDIPAGTFQGASGSDGVSNGVAAMNGAITYTEISYATERKLPTVKLENGEGKFIAPSAEAASEFLSDFQPGSNGVVKPNYLNMNPTAYNLSTFSYAISKGGSKTVKDFLQYTITTCAKVHAKDKGYAPLTGKILDIAKNQINLL